MVRLFKTKYDDQHLADRAEQALVGEPTINPTRITIVSDNGVITLGGSVKNESARLRAEEAVQRAFTQQGLKYERIVNEIALE